MGVVDALTEIDCACVDSCGISTGRDCTERSIDRSEWMESSKLVGSCVLKVDISTNIGSFGALLVGVWRCA